MLLLTARNNKSCGVPACRPHPLYIRLFEVLTVLIADPPGSITLDNEACTQEIVSKVRVLNSRLAAFRYGA